jgi:hypothetical protein
VRCSRCGNENPGPNRFCGMCGATLLAPPAPKAVEPQAAVAAPGATQVVAAPAPLSEAPRSATSVSEVPTSISGPSFLGLNDPAPRQPAARRRASLSIDPHSAAGSNLEYLLDEEEPQHHWGIGKILLILIALALAVSFGYLRWKNQGFAWLNLSKKPAVAQNSPAPDATAQSPSSSSPAITPDTQAPGGATTSQPATATPGATAPEGNTAGTPTAAPTPTPSGPSTAMPADNSKPTDKTPPHANSDTGSDASSNKTPSATDQDATTAKEESPDRAVTPAKRAEKPRTSPKPAASKPSAASTPAAANDPVAEARKYIYGRGATQDCERGMRLLKPEANHSNAKAMVEMGALYSAGLCTPHDLPTAYRWFALALRRDPENTAVQADLQKLWGEMTQPERQLAIKLSQ